MDTTNEPTATEEVTRRNRAVMERFWEAAERRDVEELAALASPDIVMTWPQSGERFTGRDNALGALQATEEKPEMAGEPELLGSGDVWVARLPLRYGSEIYHYVGIFELRDGLISRTTEYFGAPFPAPESRARFADPR